MMNRSTTGTNINLVSGASHGKHKQRHEYSRVAGKLFAVFELLCTVVRETQELAEDHKEPIMREIGGTDLAGENSLLGEALRGVATAKRRAMDAANFEDVDRLGSTRNWP